MNNGEKAITHLLTLPNELFSYLFGYLTSAEILKSFLELSENNDRLACLILPYLHHIGLLRESTFWLKTRLPKINNIIYSACVTVRQLIYLYDLPSLQTLKIVKIDSIDQLAVGLRALSTRLPQLKSIKLYFDLNKDIYHLDNNFDIALESFDLTLRCSFILIGSLVSSLRHLTIRVDTARDLFQLGQQLPIIESLFVNVLGSTSRIDDSLQEFKSFVACSPHLKRVALYSRAIVPYRYEQRFRCQFDYFEIFVRGCSSSLEYLTLDLVLPNQVGSMVTSSATIIDGDRLEQGIIASLPHLKRFEFCIEFVLDVKCIAKYQRSFTSELWRQRCIVIDYPVTDILPVSGSTDMIVFSLTHTSTIFEELSIISSRIVDWHSNFYSTAHHSQLLLATIRFITISPVTQNAILTLNLFRWMATSFPRLRHLKVVRKTNVEWQLEDETIAYPVLKSVRILYLDGEFSCELIRRFLAMCPCLEHLQVSKTKLLKQIITEPELTDNPYLQGLYQQLLQIELCGSGDYVNFDGQLRDFFPRAHFA